jgi:hypothetical protein
MLFDRQSASRVRFQSPAGKHSIRGSQASIWCGISLIVASALAQVEKSVAAAQAVASKETSIASPIADAVTQNTPGYSDGFPIGVPRRYSWCAGSYRPVDSDTPPADFTSVTGWGQVYPKAGVPHYAKSDVKLFVANAKTYVHLAKARKWILVQDQTEDELSGAHFVADLAGNRGSEMKMTALPDGSTAIDAPPIGYNDLFWIVKRGSFDAGTVDGVYVQMDLRTDDPNARLIANVGADWWRSPDAGYVPGFNNNRGVGASNWIEISTRWSTIHFYSGTSSHFLADLPPPLADVSRPTEQTLQPRRDKTSSLCPSST